MTCVDLNGVNMQTLGQRRQQTSKRAPWQAAIDRDTSQAKSTCPWTENGMRVRFFEKDSVNVQVYQLDSTDVFCLQTYVSC